MLQNGAVLAPSGGLHRRSLLPLVRLLTSAAQVHLPSPVVGQSASDVHCAIQVPLPVSQVLVGTHHW